MRGPNLQALYDVAKPGCCICCGDPLAPPKRPNGRKRVKCESAWCSAEYFRAIHADSQIDVTERAIEATRLALRALKHAEWAWSRCTQELDGDRNGLKERDR